MEAHIAFPLHHCSFHLPHFFLLQFRTDIARTEYLSNADERLRWQASSLPADDLCTENAIMLKRFNRSVSSSTVTFWLFKMTRISFLASTQLYRRSVQVSTNYWPVRPGHRVHHERVQRSQDYQNQFPGWCLQEEPGECSAFWKPPVGPGMPCCFTLASLGQVSSWIYLQEDVFMFALKDVESYDPILNPVLNREVRRTGGRVLITLGDQDIDLSPSFVIFLSTRDPTVG